MITVVIPSCKERYLEATVQDAMIKAAGPVEVIAILDGYDPPERTSGAVYLKTDGVGMRQAINLGVAAASFDYILKLDAHCMMAQGWDAQLLQDHIPGCVQVPRRYRLDPEKWEMGAEYYDYQHIVFPLKFNPLQLHGFKSPERQLARADIMLDDTFTFQGSGWFMAKEHFQACDLLWVKEYEGQMQGEPEDIGFCTRLRGGRLLVNKRVSYGHYYKPKEVGRGYFMDSRKAGRAYAYAYQRWVHDNKDVFCRTVEQFWPVPGWRSNWKVQIYG